MDIITKVQQMPKKHRLKGIAEAIHSMPQELRDYLDHHTQAELAKRLDIPQSRLSDVLLVLKAAE